MPPAILEYQSPSFAIVNLPTPRSARRLSLTMSTLVLVGFAAIGFINVDMVVTTTGRVVSMEPTMIVQSLEAGVVRSVDVRPGDVVHADQVVARLDPTFVGADVTALEVQVSALHAQVSRLQAEVGDRSFTYAGDDTNLSLQASTFMQRRAEYTSKLEGYRQKAEGLSAIVARSRADVAGYRERLAYAQLREKLCQELEQLKLGSKLKTLEAQDVRAEIQRNLSSAEQTASSAQRDLAALIADRDAYIQKWHSDAADKLAELTTKLSDTQESLRKAQLRSQFVELRASRDATVLSIGKISPGSVLAPGQQIMSLVPANAPLEVEANIPGGESGQVHVGQAVVIKFDTFPYAQHGVARGSVHTISPDSFTWADEQHNPTGTALPPVSPSSATSVWYRSRITLDRVELHNTPSGFHPSPGMPVTVDIVAGKRTVLQYLIDRAVPLATEGMREP